MCCRGGIREDDRKRKETNCKNKVDNNAYYQDQVKRLLAHDTMPGPALAPADDAPCSFRRASDPSLARLEGGGINPSSEHSHQLGQSFST